MRSPSFDCPSNLKEAIDWILRVTGKDAGSGGPDGTQQLAEAITKLPHFKQAISAAAAKLKESGGDGSEALGKLQDAGTLRSIIEQLSDGLKGFIGYSGGTIKHDGSGIGLPNDPRERLGDAVLKFITVMLEGFTVYSGPQFKDALQMQNDVSKLTTATAELKRAIGKGKDKFGTAVSQAEGQLSGVNSSAINNVWVQFKALSELKGHQNNTEQFVGKVETYLKNLLDQVTQDSNVQRDAKQAKPLVEQLKGQLVALLDELKKQTGPIDLSAKSDIYLKIKGFDDTFASLRTDLDPSTLSRERHPIARALVAGSYNGAVNFISQLKTGYKSYYQGTTWPNDEPSQKKCAKILMASLPFIFDKLGYLFWNCRQGGSWSGLTLNGSGRSQSAVNDPDLKNFMDLMSFSAYWLNGGKTGENILNKAFKHFNEFTSAASTSTSTYDVFLKSLKGNATEHLKAPTNYPLSALFYCSKAYWQGCQAKLTQTTPPSSIREMLYWLSGLQFAPGYSDLEKQIETVVTSKGLDVANSGSKHTGEQLTSDQVTEYLHTTWLYSPTVFCNIQEPGISDNAGEPWLHSLYSNSEFHFTYPSSGTALLYTLSNYIYALHFQFQFLYKQCEFDYQNGCGWWLCKFGSSVLPNDSTTVPSSLCGSVDAASGNHSGGKCGLQTQYPSPLQAFLTDKLKGFRRDLSDPYSHLAECTVGSMCHVPMGFNFNDIRSLATGGHLMIALNFF
ncbi:variant erythrocyte surface antigen-1 family protein [Babesia caballi]|uniref:Variant erythrocyte surface antigen-1 family protein n=1 Tax=Babesia caballi TaxID=5871 RepID=A0AAV4LPP8_BABCB|nr:variant erythrocyte surface antigen-1 family protein [Babesia caballi]